MPKSSPTSLDGALAMYRRHAPIYDLTRWVFLYGRRRAVDRLSLREGESALEVGCGTGSNLLHLRRLVGEAGEVHGIELSPHMLARARRKVADRGWRNVLLHEQNAEAFDLGRRFDAVLYSYSLTMIPDWRRSLESAQRHLDPGGRLVVVDFGTLRGLGWFRPVLLHWLRLHHVDAERPFVQALAELFPPGAVTVERGFGDWRFIARCVKGGGLVEVPRAGRKDA